MVARLTVEEFFQALHDQQVYPLVDTPEARQIVLAVARAEGKHYPIKDRWPVIDLAYAYEGHVNNIPQAATWDKRRFNGTIQLRGFDDTYTLDEWFDDFRIQWQLVDNRSTREKMLSALPKGGHWTSPQLYEAHKAATQGTLSGLVRRIFHGR